MSFVAICKLKDYFFEKSAFSDRQFTNTDISSPQPECEKLLFCREKTLVHGVHNFKRASYPRKSAQAAAIFLISALEPYSPS